MNYLLVYNRLIKTGQNRLPFPGCHRHRIIPGYQGGKYIPENLTYLTRQEHRIIHKIRFKLFRHYGDMTAYTKLGGKDPIRYHLSEQHKQNLSKAKKGKKMSVAYCESNSEAQKRLHASGYLNPFKGKQHSIESRNKMSIKLKGRIAWNKGLPNENARQRMLNNNPMHISSIVTKALNTKRINLECTH